MNSKITYILMDKLKQENKTQAQQHYLNIIDQLLEPILAAENQLIDNNINEFYTTEDFYQIVKEALTDIKLVKIPKYKDITIKEYIKAQEEAQEQAQDTEQHPQDQLQALILKHA